MTALTPEKIGQLEPKVREFAEALQKGITAFKEAGRIVAEEIDKDPKFHEKIVKQTNGEISASIVRRFEKLGRGKVIPQFMLCWDKPGIKKLRQLSASMQQHYLTNGVKLVVEGGDILIVDPRNLTKLQAKQVFEGDEIRTDAEQRAWIESEKTAAKIGKVDKVEDVYTITKGKIVFNRPCQFDVDELMKILVNRR